MGLSFLDPLQGLIGFIGLVSGNILGGLIAPFSLNFQFGVYGLNCFYMGLFLGNQFKVNTAFLVVFFLSLFVMVFLCKVFESIFNHRGLPIGSIPFNVGAVFLSLSLQNYPSLISREPVYHLLGSSLEVFGIALSNLLYLKSFWVSLAMVVVVFFYSRISFVCGVTSSLVCFGISLFLATDGRFIQGELLVFNGFLLGLGMGSVFFVPGLASFGLVIFTSCLLVPIQTALFTLFYPWGLPIFTLPFNIIHALTLFSFRRLTVPGLIPNPYWYEVPEIARKRFDISKKLVYETRPLFHLPFFGSWLVTQGHHDHPTHQGKWPHAWDFVVENEIQVDFNKQQTYTHQDFLTFGVPVLSPSEGVIVYSENGVDENPPFGVNQEKNWGNEIIFHHGPGLFSRICHFKKGSLLPPPGGYVQNHTRLGLVGNSGRSPTPHIHFQFQGTAVSDSPTFSFPLSNYVKKEELGWKLIFQGIPKKGEVVARFIPDYSLEKIFDWKLDRKWEFTKKVQGLEVSEETWLVDLDFYSTRFLKNGEGENLFFSWTASHFQFLQPPLRLNSLLSLFALLMPIAPLGYKEEVFWDKDLTPDFFISPLFRLLPQVLFFFNGLFKAKGRYRFRGGKDAVIAGNNISLLCLESSFYLKGLLGKWTLVGQGKIWLDKETGPVVLEFEDTKKGIKWEGYLKGFEAWVERA